MFAVSLLGYLAAAVSTASFLPQAWKIIKSRQTKDISFGMYFLTVAAFGLWLTFGILVQQWPLVVSNSICFILSAFILMMKVVRRDRFVICPLPKNTTAALPNTNNFDNLSIFC